MKIRETTLRDVAGRVLIYEVNYPEDNRKTTVRLQLPQKEVLDETCEGKWRIHYVYAGIADRMSHAPTSYEKLQFNAASGKYDIEEFRAERVEIKDGGQLVFKVLDTGDVHIRYVFEFDF